MCGIVVQVVVEEAKPTTKETAEAEEVAVNVPEESTGDGKRLMCDEHPLSHAQQYSTSKVEVSNEARKTDVLMTKSSCRNCNFIKELQLRDSEETSPSIGNGSVTNMPFHHNCKGIPWQVLQKAISNRGPDARRSLQFTVETRSTLDENLDISSKMGFRSVFLAASVLHMRGPLIEQPIYNLNDGKTRDQPSSVLSLVYNGEIYEGLDGLLSATSDSFMLYKTLQSALSVKTESKHPSASACSVIDIISQLRGPWTLVFYDLERKEMWFGRDYFGRRSLVIGAACDLNSPTVVLSSCVSPAMRDNAVDFVWREVPAVGIYRLSLSDLSPGHPIPIECFLWDDFGYKLSMDGRLVADRDKNCLEKELLDMFNMEQVQLTVGVQALSCPISPFNTKIDFTILQQFNSASDNISLHQKAQSDCAVHGFSQRLREAIRLRTIAFKANNSAPETIGILFSGGIDCMVLSVLADEELPIWIGIDLINVAFENPKRKTANPKDIFSVPDRITGLESYQELCDLSKKKHDREKRQIRFIQVNVTQEELEQHRQHIRSLVDPLDTVLDDSIGCAIWFAARGIGVLHESIKIVASSEHSANHVATVAGSKEAIRQQSKSMISVSEESKAKEDCNLSSLRSAGNIVHSTARILLLGMGADEQLGGYGRHRSAWSKRGWEAAQQEVFSDIRRISSRNLGRDDRYVRLFMLNRSRGDHGKEGRYPFLDEHVVSYLNSLPLRLKMDFNLPRGVGEKKLLRQVAETLGIEIAKSLPKRAIQFGSRIAKMYDNNNVADAKYR